MYLPLLPFQPRVHDGSGDHNLLKAEIINKKHADLICITLDKYDEVYFRAGEKIILITPKLFLDKEMIWNYSNKSQRF